jgi:hypothetical protein
MLMCTSCEYKHDPSLPLRNGMTIVKAANYLKLNTGFVDVLSQPF